MIETYIPLYRKYRPQQFSDLVGQEVVSTAVSNALTLKKIAHAYLFCGPRGTGKTSSARIMAKSLNCEQGPTPTPCQTCPSCVAITQGSAVDVTEIDAASNNGVENIRDLTDKVHFSPLQGKYKIYIIDEVHMLSNAAFNALLKTLEEPPPNVVFIFATTEPHKVLPTIISRCQRFDFNRITRQQIEARLSQVAEWEAISITPEAVSMIARYARGGLRDALGLLDQVSVLGRSQEGYAIQPDDVRTFIGVLEEDLVLQLTQGIINKQPDEILGQLRVFQDRGIDPPQTVKELTQHFRNLLIAKTCGPSADPDPLDISPDLYQQLCTQAQGLDVEEIPQILSRLASLETQLRHSQQPQLWLEIGLLDLGYREDIHVVKTLAERVTQLEAQLAGGAPTPVQHRAPQPAPARPSAPPPAMPPQVSPAPGASTPPAASPLPPAAPPAPVPQSAPAPAQPVAAPMATSLSSNLHNTWQQMLSAMNHVPTHSLASQHFALDDISDSIVTLNYATEAVFNTFKQSANKMEVLQRAIEQVLDKPCQLRFVIRSTSAASPSPAPAMAPPPVMSPQPVATVPAPEAPVSSPVLQAEEPRPEPTAPPTPVVPDHPPVTLMDDGMVFEMEEAKKYTQELLQGKLLE